MKMELLYYLNQNTLYLAKDLLGKILYTAIDGELTAARIVATEAYCGITDKASHAYGGRRTNRTENLFATGGIAYVYLCYGIHNLFNVVTGNEGEPNAVLIRAVEPLFGQDIMEKRRNMPATRSNITSGPGSVAKALGIDRTSNGYDLTSSEIWIADDGKKFAEEEIAAVPRVGVAYAMEDAFLPWRYFVIGNRFVSKPNKIQLL